jgi:hypothetical protein
MFVHLYKENFVKKFLQTTERRLCINYVCDFLEHLGVDFMSFLFDLIESPPDTDVEEQIPDLFLNLVLAYKLQFTPDVENVMLKALLERTVAKTFTEKTLLLLNREGKKRQQFAPCNPLLNSTPYTKLCGL